MKAEVHQTNELKTCYYCNKNILEDYLQLSCKHIYCMVCLFNTFQDFSDNNLCTFFQCKCKTVIFYPSIIDYISLDSLLIYIENVSSRSLQINNEIFICPKNHKCSLIYICKTINNCTVCGYKFCLKCGISHINQTCYEHFTENFLPNYKKLKGECRACKNVLKDLTLKCGCKYCNNCLKDYIIDQMSNPKIQDFKCIEHDVYIIKADIYNAFGSKNIFLTIQNQIKPKHSLTFYCEICFDNHEITNSIILNCEHRFCQKILSEYFIFEIRNGKLFDDINCPLCHKNIEFDIVKNNIPDDFYNKYFEISIKRYKPKDENEIMKRCISCNTRFIVDKNERKYTCNLCNKKYCIKCDKQHDGIECELEDSFTIVEKNILFDGKNEFYKKNYVKCPCCKNVLHKISGCNFIKCIWPECRGETFCLLCKKILKVFFI